MSDPQRPRVSVEGRATKRVRFNVLGGEERRQETEEEWVRIYRSPQRDLFFRHDSQGGPKLSDISKRRESRVCSTDGGERRIVDRFRKSWEVLSYQTKPPAEGDLSRDVKGDPLRSKAKGGTLAIHVICAKVVADPREAPEACHRIMCILFCTVLYLEQIRRRAWFLHDLSGGASQLCLPCMMRLECRRDVFHAPGNARDRWDGGRVSFLTNSPHIARKGGRVQTSRESGLRDLRESSTTSWRRKPDVRRDAFGEWNTDQPRRFESPDTEEAQSAE